MTAPGGRVRALGPVVLTSTELGLLEDAHRRLLADQGPDADAEGDGGPAARSAGRGAGAPGEDAGVREARRSLVARGLLAEDGGLPEEDDLGLLVSTLLDLRLAAEVVLAVERVTAVRCDAAPGEVARDPAVARGTRLVHVAGSAACVEDLLPGDAHHLHLLLEREDVPAWLAGATVPADAAPAAGPPLTADPTRPERLATLLGHPTVLAEVAVLRPSGPADVAPPPAVGSATGSATGPGGRCTHHLLALGPSGCWHAELDPGRPLPAQVVLHPVHPGWVGEWAEGVLGAGPAAASWENEPREQGTMAR